MIRDAAGAAAAQVTAAPMTAVHSTAFHALSRGDLLDLDSSDRGREGGKSIVSDQSRDQRPITSLVVC